MRTAVSTSVLAAAGVIGLAGLASSASAHGEGDLGFLFDSSGNLTTFVADDESGAFDEPGEAVFAADMDAMGLADGPGFFTTDGATVPAGYAALVAGSTVSYRTIAALRVYDAGTDSYVATDAQLAQDSGGMTVFTPTTDMSVAGFSYDYSGGEFDQHPDFGLVGTGGLGTADAGAYLWQFRLSVLDSSGNLIDETGTIGYVFNFGLDEDAHEAAIEAAEGIVPAPGAAGVLAVGGLVGLRRRRR